MARLAKLFQYSRKKEKRFLYLSYSADVFLLSVILMIVKLLAETSFSLSESDAEQSAMMAVGVIFVAVVVIVFFLWLIAENLYNTVYYMEMPETVDMDHVFLSQTSEEIREENWQHIVQGTETMKLIFWAILKDISCNFEPGKIYTISGPSGSGKTTFLYAMAGLLDHVQGSVKIGETEILRERRQVRDQIRLNWLGMIFQNLNLFDFMNVEDNILIPYYLRKQRIPPMIHRQIADYLEQLNLGQIQKKQISSLSGGEQQRVAIIRAIVAKPQIILCDEPTASLDSGNVRIFMEALLTLQRESRSTIVIVTHDQRVFEYGDRQIRITDGELTAN